MQVDSERYEVITLDTELRMKYTDLKLQQLLLLPFNPQIIYLASQSLRGHPQDCWFSWERRLLL